MVTKTQNRMERKGLFHTVLFRILLPEAIQYLSLNPENINLGIPNPKLKLLLITGKLRSVLSCSVPFQVLVTATLRYVLAWIIQLAICSLLKEKSLWWWSQKSSALFFGLIMTPYLVWHLHPCEDIRAIEQLQHHMPPNSFYTIITFVNMVECHYYKLCMPMLIFCWAVCTSFL